MALHHGCLAHLWCCTISTIERVKVQNINTADILELETERIPKIVLPVMPSNQNSLELALEWAESLMRKSGEAVTVYRNGTFFITIPATRL